jgi:hypothetical protein
MFAHLNFNMYKKIGVKVENEHCYDHIQISVEKCQVGKVTLSWNQQVRTERTIPSNKPDIIIHAN